MIASVKSVTNKNIVFIRAKLQDSLLAKCITQNTSKYIILPINIITNLLDKYLNLHLYLGT